MKGVVDIMMLCSKKPNNSVLAPAMIGALTALTVGGILIVSVMYCDPLKNFLMCAKREAKKAYKVVENDMKVL